MGGRGDSEPFPASYKSRKYRKNKARREPRPPMERWQPGRMGKGAFRYLYRRRGAIRRRAHHNRHPAPYPLCLRDGHAASNPAMDTELPWWRLCPSYVTDAPPWNSAEPSGAVPIMDCPICTGRRASARPKATTPPPAQPSQPPVSSAATAKLISGLYRRNTSRPSVKKWVG
uniref:Uncharacterized protein n=1 Tax=Candidatus Kentrum sp. DK TaxID=2126562 RepID=A0A450SCW2_9GAMM|nr:MAG: hypothetical protein BECKDK2373B_GA0170837_102721 [Candidatus Kentron sp. DK]